MTKGYRSWSGVAVVAITGLLFMGANCRETDITLVLEESSGRCKNTEAIQRNELPAHGLSLNFAIDNRCSATQWVEIDWEGHRPLVECSSHFPLLDWREFSKGEREAGSCVLSMEDGHCHRVNVRVRSGPDRPSALAAAASKDCVTQDHSLDFQDVPP